MKLAKIEITVTKEEAKVIAAKLLEGKDGAHARPEDAVALAGVTFAAAGSRTEPTAGNSSATMVSMAAQAYLAAD